MIDEKIYFSYSIPSMPLFEFIPKETDHSLTLLHPDCPFTFDAYCNKSDQSCILSLDVTIVENWK